MISTFAGIASKYGEFSAPCAEVKIDGKSIKQLSGIALTAVKADLDIEKSNVAEIRLMSTEDDPEESFRKNIEKRVMLGSTLEVLLGYGSKTETVFYGYIGKLDFMQDETGEKGVVVYGFDVRRLMMASVRDKAYEGSLKAGIIKQIFSDYQKTVKKLVCEVTGSIEGNVSQNDTDYNFIMKYLLGSETPKKEFYVAGGTAYIKSPEADIISCVTTLEKGAGLYSFSDSGNYLDSEIEVHGYDAQKGESFEAGAKASSGDKQKKINTIKRIIGSGGIISKAEAKKIADRISGELKNKAGGGEASCVGIPELLPGSSVKLSIKDMGISDYYLIRGAEHSFSDGDGYTVRLRFGRDELGDALSGEASEKDPHGELPKSEENGLMYGRIVDNWDDQNPDRLLIELSIGEKGKTRTEWIPYIIPYGGKDYGLCMRPEAGAQVAVGFLSGDKNMPVVLGVVREKNDSSPKETNGKENEVKAIITKAGHKIVFSETKEPYIEVSTAGGLKLFLDDKNALIKLSGKEGKNALVINEKENAIELSAEKKIVLSAGKSKLELSDTDISIDGGKLNINGEQQLKIKAPTTGIEGNSVEVKGGGSLKLESGGATEVKGSLLKLN